jgi:hypothetical protein
VRATFVALAGTVARAGLSLRFIMRTIDDAFNHLRAEFLEMPGMHLKPEQVRRLCGVDRELCQTVLDSLVDAKFLCVCADGQYARVTDGEVSRHRSARVGVRIDTRAQAS